MTEKKRVHYDSTFTPYKYFGNGVILKPLDHPDSENVSNTCPVRTSAVINWDKETGIIETQNTIYIPV
jgi:hypothetical protein